MPSNVSVEFSHAQMKYDQAKSPEEKLVALLEMKSSAPQHKGAENLRSDISKKISELKSSIERQKTQSKKGSAPSLYVKKEGVGQIVLVGLPNSGKSWLLNKLAGKEITPSTPYPFATTEPAPAMMNYEGGLIQVVEVPAIVEGSAEGKSQGRELLALVRNADAIVFVASDTAQLKILNGELSKSHIYINRTRPPIDVKASSFPGIQVSGKEFLKFGQEQLIDYLKSSGFSNASVLISGTLNSISDVAEALNEKIVYKKAMAINPFDFSEHKMVDWKCQMFLLLDKILVYTKKPGQEPDYSDPLSLKKGDTLHDLAKELHKDFASKLKYARVWGSTKFPGQRVGPEYELKHKDIVEIAI